MIRFARFTNASQGREGHPLYINLDYIVSIYEEPTDGGSLKTVIYGGPRGTTWIVEESLNEVMKIIRGTE